MKYRAIFFDFDDTLVDFEYSQNRGFHQVLDDLKSELDLGTLYQDYNTISSDLWLKVEAGVITKEELRVDRYRLLFEKHDINKCPHEAAHDYLESLVQHTQEEQGAHELCEYLKDHYHLALLTNGFKVIQGRRLNQTRFGQHFSLVLTSEEVLRPKPFPDIFHLAIKHFDLKPDQVLMVGDSLSSDISGGMAAGVDTCWYNPKKQKTVLSPTFIIGQLSELRTLL